MEKLFQGSTLINDSGDKVPVSSISGEGKVVGLYFSAHWCPPCRSFTPLLANWYKKFKETENKDKFEIVFVSSDRDLASFKEYFDEMPWLGLSYEDRDKKSELSKKFKVTGIPTLVFVHGDSGNLITADGRAVVMEDEEGKEFPWMQKKFADIIPGELINKEGVKSEWSDIDADVIGLYFSAHWCGPCRAFTPLLTKTYQKIKDAGKSFEMIFVSSDRDEDAMKEYLASMPWLSLPYGDKRKKSLSRAFDIQGIPSLIILKKDGEVITTQGRNGVSADPDGKDFPWYPKPVNQLVGSTAGEINDTASLIWHTKNAKGAEETLRGIAEKYLPQVKAGSKEEMIFFYSSDDIKDDDDDVWDSLKNFAGIEAEDETLCVINIPDQKVYVHTGPAITAEVIEKLLSDYNSNTLETRPLRK